MQKYTRKIVKKKQSPQELAKIEQEKQNLELELKQQEDKANQAR